MFGVEDAYNDTRFQPSTGAPTGFAENVSSAFNAARAVELSHSRMSNINKEFEKQKDLYEQLSGEEAPRHPLEDSGRAQSPSTKAKFELLSPKIQEFVRLHPEHDDKFLTTFDQVTNKANEQAVEIFRQNEQIFQRATNAGAIGNFIGGAGGQITDPVPLLLLPFGAGEVSLLRFVLTEASLGALGDASVQPFIQSYREELGLEHGLGKAVESIALSGVSAGVLGGILKGGAQGIKSLRDRLSGKDTPEIDRALDRLVHESEEQLLDPSVLRNSIERDAHRSNVDEVIRQFHEEQEIRVPSDDAYIRNDLYSGTALRNIRGGLERFGGTDDLPLELDSFEEVSRQLNRARDINRADQAQIQLDEQIRATEGKAREISIQMKSLEQEIIAVNKVLADYEEGLRRIREGRPVPRDAKTVDAATLGRLEEISKEIEKPGVSRKRRQELEKEAEIINSSIANEAEAGIKARIPDLENKLRSLHDTRISHLRDLDKLSAQDTALRNTLRRRNQDFVAKRAEREKALRNVGARRNVAPTPKAKAVREQAAVTRAVEEEQLAEQIDEINDQQFAEAQSVLEEDPNRLFYFDLENEAGEVTPTPVRAESVLNDIKDKETLLRELEACLATPGGGVV